MHQDCHRCKRGCCESDLRSWPGVHARSNLLLMYCRGPAFPRVNRLQSRHAATWLSLVFLCCKRTADRSTHPSFHEQHRRHHCCRCRALAQQPRAAAQHVMSSNRTQRLAILQVFEYCESDLQYEHIN